MADARDAVYLRTGFSTDDSQLTPERVTQCLRTSSAFIGAERDWDWLEAQETLTTTSGTAYVTPLAGSATGVTWTRTTHLTGPNNDDIAPVGWTDFRRLPTASTGQPDRWSDRLGRLYLWPTPDGTYSLTHDFIRGEVALTQDSDTPLLPAQFHDAWVEYAAYLCFRRVGEVDRAGEAYQAYQEWLRVMVDNRHRSRAPKSVSVRPGSLV